jgi:hypothetical protein
MTKKGTKMKTLQKKTQGQKLLSAREILEEDSQRFVSNTLDLPPTATLFKVETDRKPIMVDIIPYIVGNNNPKKKKGEVSFVRSYYIHRNIGPNNEMVICPKHTYGHNCPICEEIDRLGWDDEVAKTLRPSWRQLWNIIDTMHRKEGIQVWDIAQWNFGKALSTADKSLSDGDPRLYFADPGQGYTLKVTFVEEAVPGRKYFKAERVDFEKRKRQYNELIKKKAWCLDEILKPAMSYKELKELFLQTSSDGEEKDKYESDGSNHKRDEAMKRKPVTAKTKGIKKGSNVEHEDFGKCIVEKVSRDGYTLSLQDEDGDEHLGIGVAEVVLLKEKKGPKKMKVTKRGRKTKQVEEDEEDSELEDEEDSELEDEEDSELEDEEDSELEDEEDSELEDEEDSELEDEEDEEDSELEDEEDSELEDEEDSELEDEEEEEVKPKRGRKKTKSRK